jgi:toxin ParE1/3/4
MTKPVWTRHAQSDVDAIFNYIANDSRIYALRIIESIESAASAAARMPESGGIVSEFDDSSIREVLTGRYRIIYRLRSSDILVLTVLHGARNLTTLPDQD